MSFFLKIFLLFWIVLFALNSNAQTIKVEGSVIENENNLPLVGANVLLKGDQSYAVVTDKVGVFNFKDVKPGNYSLHISYVGYKTSTTELSNISGPVKLEKIKLTIDKSAIEELVFEGNIPLATVKGDTIAYHADAYKTNPDADAEDLVKKMPGIVVNDGKVEAQGEDVKKVYVDGKPFFDQDPTLALRSLPAEVIQKIEVFDEQSEQAQFTGFDDGETNKVMNIITRTKMKNGQFGKLSAGLGYPDKYQLGGNVNFFNDDRRISLLGHSNNVNQQNFSNEDLLGVISSSGRKGGGSKGGRGGRGGKQGGGNRSDQGVSSKDFMVGSRPGISNTHAFGLNYSDTWGSKINVAGSYFFNGAENNTDQKLIQQYFTDSDISNQQYTESNTSHSTNYNHRFHFKFDYDINDNNKLMIRPRLSIQSNNSDNTILSSSFLNDSLLNQNLNNLSRDMQGYNFSNQILFMHKFSKTGRTVSVSLNTARALKASDNLQYTERIDFETLMASDSLNQFTDYQNISNGVSGKLVYTEPIGENGQFMLNTNSSISYNDSDRDVYKFNYADNAYNLYDTILSNVFNSRYSRLQFGGGYRLRMGKNHFMIGLNYQYAKLNNEQKFPEEYSLNQTFTSILPMLRIKFNISDSRNINVFYRSNTQSPTIDQLQYTVDNSNPLQLSVGNPGLEQSYQQSFFIKYSSTNVSKATVFFIMGGMSNSMNYIANNTWYAVKDTLLNNSILLQQGGQLTQPVNLDNYWNFRIFSTYGFPVKQIKSNLNINLSYNFSHTPGIYNTIKSYSRNNIFGVGLVLASNISENIDFTVGSKTSYNKANSTSYNQMDDSYLNQKTELSLNLIFWKGMVLRTSYASQYYFWTVQDHKESFYLLNLELGKKVFKNQLGEIRLSAFDVLNQNNSFSRNVTDAYVEDIRTNVLQQYFMLTFTYRIKNFI